MKIKVSFIIPVYNRPEEIKELLQSFLIQDTIIEYEIIISEDGSTETSEDVISSFQNLPIRYFYKPNSGPGDSRNYGMKHATGDFFIILDSDCILPPHYFKELARFLENNKVDCFGGPDRAHQDFSPVQKAINYTMTSFLTTGGIRGHKKQIQKFEPRSFNMGLSKKAFIETGGFGNIHPGEDPDLVQNILKRGFTTGFAPDVFVYHKRRISFEKFHIQVKKFGAVRAILNKWHPQSSKITFWFPTFFVIFSIVSVLLLLYKIYIPFLLLLIYNFLVFIDASIKNKSLYIGLLSIMAMYIQFYGYGIAFFKATVIIQVLKRDIQQSFPKLFFIKS